MRSPGVSKLGVSLLTLLLIGLVTAAGLAQPLTAPASPPLQRQSAPWESAEVTAHAPDFLFSAAAVVATGFNIPVRHAICGVGEVVGFFAGSVLRLPVWALTLGDRLGSSEPLDRFGASVIEKACDGPLILAADQLKGFAPTLEGMASVERPAATREGP